MEEKKTKRKKCFEQLKTKAEFEAFKKPWAAKLAEARKNNDTTAEAEAAAWCVLCNLKCNS